MSAPMFIGVSLDAETVQRFAKARKAYFATVGSGISQAEYEAIRKEFDDAKEELAFDAFHAVPKDYRSRFVMENDAATVAASAELAASLNDQDAE
jgi:hypothetical protein